MNPPRDLSVEALDKWIERVRITSAINGGIRPGAAVRSLVEEKVREAVGYVSMQYDLDSVREDIDIIVSRIMGTP